MVSSAKSNTLKLAPKLQTNRSLNLLPVALKTNSSTLTRLEMAGIAQHKQKCLIFSVVPHFRVENQIS